MIKRTKLLAQLDKLINLEDSLVPLLNRHISSVLHFSKLTKTSSEMVTEYFQETTITLTKHVRILNEIKTQLLEEEDDVY